jgi:hypothetical protein
MLLEKQNSYIFSSNPENGAVNVTPDGSSFSVQLNSPVTIPAEAVYATLEVVQANVWWTVFNISAANNNNKLYVYTDWVAPDGGVPPTGPNFIITIEDGLYGMEELQSVLARELSNLALPTDLFTLSGDVSTQKTIISFNYDAVISIDFTKPDSFREILGFDSRFVPLTPKPAGYIEYSDKIARFNQISSFLMNTDLISNGSPVNNTSIGTIANVLIDVKPGPQINYTPVISTKADASELIGKSKNYFSFRLTDQNRTTVNTNGEYYSLTVVIKYYLPFTENTKGVSASSRG